MENVQYNGESGVRVKHLQYSTAFTAQYRTCCTMGEVQSKQSIYSTVENVQYNEGVAISIEHLQYSKAFTVQ